MSRRLNELIEDTDSDSDLEYQPAIRRPRWIMERHNFFDEYDDLDFAVRFRLSKESALSLLGRIEHHLKYVSDRNVPISPINQLLTALRFYATNNTQMTIGDYSGFSKATCNKVIHKVSSAIASLHKDFIKFPNNANDIKTTQAEFYEIAKFPKVIGAMDCTHVRIASPGGEEAEIYRNRKGYFSINVQTIGNANLEIIDLVSRWPGSSHDSTIFNNSCIRAKFESGTYGDALLVVDGGYASTTYMIPPLENPQTPAEKLFNESQIRTRNPIERLFGVWKRRFPVLTLEMRVKLDKVLTIIVAAAVLHNILRCRGEDVPPDDPEVHLPVPWDRLIQEGQVPETALQSARRGAVRNALIENYFQSLL